MRRDHLDWTFDAAWRSVTEPPVGKVSWSKDVSLELSARVEAQKSLHQHGRDVVPPVGLVRLEGGRAEPELEAV